MSSRHALLVCAALLLAAGAALLSARSDRTGGSAVHAQPPGVTPPATAPTSWSVVGTLGAFVQVADGCSHYPLTKCDNTEVQVSEMSGGGLRGYVGQTVLLRLVTAECGRGIAGQALYGPVAVRVALTGPCDGGPVLCDALQKQVPAAVIQAAMANPETVMGWGERCNPGAPAGPFNGRRANLTLLNTGAPFHPTFNPVVFKCGCP